MKNKLLIFILILIYTFGYCGSIISYADSGMVILPPDREATTECAPPETTNYFQDETTCDEEMTSSVSIDDFIKREEEDVETIDILGDTYTPVSDRIDEIKKEYALLEQEIEKSKKALNNVETGINNNAQRVAILSSEIDLINTQISLLEQEETIIVNDISSLEEYTDKLQDSIDKINELLPELSENIVLAEEELNTAKENLYRTIVNKYITGQDTGLALLLTSDNLLEYYERKEMLSLVSDTSYSRIKDAEEKLAALQSEKQEQTEQINALNSQMEIMAVLKENYYTEVNELEILKENQSTKISELKAQEAETRQLILEMEYYALNYQNTINEDINEMEILAKEVDTYIGEHGSILGDIPSAEYHNTGKMIWPVAFSSYLSASYPAYSNGNPHYGIDICSTDGNTLGRSALAAQGGVVIIAVNDGKWNYGFGNYCVIDHGDGTQTLYAHAKTLLVSKGDIVTQGQPILQIGSTGNSSGPHLHFEVRVKKSDGTVQRVNPLTYVKNTTR